jgi:hypothetical protein
LYPLDSSLPAERSHIVLQDDFRRRATGCGRIVLGGSSTGDHDQPEKYMPLEIGIKNVFAGVHCWSVVAIDLLGKRQGLSALACRRMSSDGSVTGYEQI